MSSTGYQELLSAFTNQTAHDCVPLPHPDRQIRVLDLVPVYSNDPNTTPALHGSLRVLSLPTSQAYSAISYVWAQEDPGTSARENQLVIHCNGHQHNVQLGPNCWSALWHIIKIRGPHLVWIDAVCIDQRSDQGQDVNKEKLQQLPLMRTIYASAHTTYFWLGEAAKGTDAAMDYLATSKLSINTGSIGERFGAVFELYWHCGAFSLPPHQAGLEEIFNRPWIRRLWVLQECLLSRRGIIVCGLKSIPWPDLICALESIHQFRTGGLGICFDGSYQPWFNLANISRWFAKADRGPLARDQQLHHAPEGFDLLESRIQGQVQCHESTIKIFRAMTMYGVLLWLPFWVTLALKATYSYGKWYYLLMIGIATPITIYTTVAFMFYPGSKMMNIFPAAEPSIVTELRNRKVTNSKDMYYGTVGIFGHGPLDAEEVLYTLYRRLCTGVIEKTQTLDILPFANIYSCDDYPGDNFPSWVIKWNSATPQIWGKALHSKRIFRQYGVPLDTRYSITERIANHFKENVRGAFRNGINEEYNGLSSLFEKYEGATPGTKPLYDFRDGGESLCIYGVTLTHVTSHFKPLEETRGLASVLRDGLSSMSESDSVRAIQSLQGLMAVSMEDRSFLYFLDGWWEALETPTGYDRGTEWIEDLMVTDESLRWKNELVNRLLRDKRLSAVRCEANAMCPGGPAFAGIGAQEGDTVVLVSGVPFPLALRPCGQQRFRLIGPVFLPGVMDGELKDVLTPESFHEIVLV